MGRLWLDSGVEVNRWLYALVNLRGPLGRQFRTDHEGLLLRLADHLLQRFHARTGHAPSFLFLDLDRADRSLAMKYWPRYRTIATRHPDCLLAAQWDYLVRMEPLATVQMYLDPWRESTHDNSSRHDALSKLRVLPDAKRQAVLDAAIQDVRQATRPSADWRGSLPSWQECVIQQLERYASDEHAAEVTLARLHEDSSERTRRRIALWLEHTRPDHPLVGRLAQQEDPQLRLLAVPALEAHPTRRNREVLRCLLSDPDVQVRAAATQVDAELGALAARDPMDFALGAGVSELLLDARRQSP